jgi:hypothetical protein
LNINQPGALPPLPAVRPLGQANQNVAAGGVQVPLVGVQPPPAVPPAAMPPAAVPPVVAAGVAPAVGAVAAGATGVQPVPLVGNIAA